LRGFTMNDVAIGLQPAKRTTVQKLLTSAIAAVLALHVILILVLGQQSVPESRLCIAVIPFLAAVCLLWRAHRLPTRERLSWQLLSLALLFWAAGQVVEILIGRSTAASNLSVDLSDFFYITAAFPVLLAISGTREAESIRAVFYLDAAQILLALVLTYVLLFQIQLPPDQATIVMARIYAAECSLLAISTIVRLVSWSTLEERRRVRTLCAVVWIYLPIELGMDYATKNWNLRAGTLLDLLWSVPFVYAAWQALHLPIDESAAGRRSRFVRGRMLVESLCPMLVTTGVFALAASVANQHGLLALSAIFVLLLVQGLHAGVVQVKYLAGQDLLLERERALKDANSALEELSMLDPLTGISNRRRFSVALEDAWNRALRKQEAIAVLMIDVDFFKRINDLHGHAYGDECLTEIAKILSHQTRRSNDLLARYGGEEFTLLLPETSETAALAVAERMHAAVYTMGILNDASPFDHRLTVSVGIGVTTPGPGMNQSGLMEIADQALYEAKRLGRNRICMKTIA
jgi:diguanylate cyclase (GGDEF)-like protein